VGNLLGLLQHTPTEREGRKPMSIGERDLVFEDCEPFVTPFLPENFID
jgi:hypothetical protein